MHQDVYLEKSLNCVPICPSDVTCCFVKLREMGKRFLVKTEAPWLSAEGLRCSTDSSVYVRKENESPHFGLQQLSLFINFNRGHR